MVPDISTGSRTYGLLNYLYGPGRREEHTDPHLVAAWMPGLAPDPGRDPAATLKQLTDRLDLPVLALPKHRRPARHVWHCPVRTAPGDRHLTDAEWAEVARRIVHATGIAEEGDDKACRWIAVRHADDHIHIVATLKREDGRSPRRHEDGIRAQAECRKIEAEFGLQILNDGDRTAAQRPASAERSKAERAGRVETPRETLRERVRQALAGATTEEEFFRRLAEAGLRVEKRLAPSGDTLGYKVALPGDRNRDGEPIWFSGSKLAPDLSLPKIRQRLDSGLPDDDASAIDRPGERVPRPARVRREAAPAVERATSVLSGDDDADSAAQLVGLGELLDGLAQTSPASTRKELTEAARAFERATRSHTRAEGADNRALRSAARGIIRAGNALGKGEDGGATAMLLSTMVLVTIAAARWHSARGHAQQAAAAQQAAQHLRAAYRTAATTPMNAMREHGRRLPEPIRQRYAGTLEATLPEQADRLLREPSWDALAATLDQAERAGHDPDVLLQQAIAWRELDTADNVTDVLVWRLRRLGKLPATVNPPRTRTNSRPPQRQPQPPKPQAPESAARPNLNDPRQRGARR
ncbi:relaxase/mobilization nuclease domain-containing protein [Streptomyces sp. Je 1-4]|uniref:relaxase/mobilization nuclease domain-containing protein n=1 Tax=Streptomyces TaxID=1883 RepID=UPI0021DAE7DD|nr:MULTISPECIES: relaxase/mobilization nuclease domain-containing protein [unclassified Streptomyces]UYB40916.1 relaxase/mobilization nuclease domain-containing protein [Streptomyces sp. Je 1-4]UZQ37076.1 relaxase/mobilization nuclease domain-containing protein [Streptomyces sp. Je 1-4] [Streptomyces sp. Je 1-4 4N24]UZQ44493.1 relaxase/mobilization nuclease domain-containing protein [Streptomyces sp. Je 1-4] [Streptomyces sp. Je 1-4 4N24_ara]